MTGASEQLLGIVYNYHYNAWLYSEMVSSNFFPNSPVSNGKIIFIRDEFMSSNFILTALSFLERRLRFILFHYRLNFDQSKKNKIYQSSSKEHLKISLQSLVAKCCKIRKT